jgi:hypothetical protein
MIDIDSIASQVKHNCNISDAKYWGYYSPCGLLLRLRDLYKVESGLKPRDKVNHKTIGSWIDKREELWHSLEARDFEDIKVNGRRCGPFDIKSINKSLLKQGYFYGAGFGNMLKPVFILAELTDRIFKGKYRIHIVDREIARDLSTSPAMIQGNTIIARQQTMKIFLWGKFEEMSSRKCAGSLHHAFSEYGISGNFDEKSIEKKFPRVVQEELSTYIYHELGEAAQRRILGTWWKQLLLKIPYSRAELFVRAVKDIMSDTCRTGMLAYIIESKKRGSLSFYVSLLSGFRKVIFPEIVTAYGEFNESGNWDIIENARAEGYRKAGDYVRKLKNLFDKGTVTPDAIEQEVLAHIM